MLTQKISWLSVLPVVMLLFSLRDTFTLLNSVPFCTNLSTLKMAMYNLLYHLVYGGVWFGIIISLASHLILFEFLFRLCLNLCFFAAVTKKWMSSL